MKFEFGWFFLVPGVLGLVVSILLRRRALLEKTPKVLFLTTHLGLGGLERMILNLAKNLETWEPIIFVYDELETSGATLHEEFRKAGISVISMKKDPGFSFKVVFRIAREVVRTRALYIHSHDLGALIYAIFVKWLCLGSVKVVNTQHSFVHLTYKKSYRYLDRFFTFFADVKTAVSEGIQQQYKTIHVRTNDISVIPNGVEFPREPLIRWSDLAEKREQLIREIRDPVVAHVLRKRVDTQWVLCMARIHPGKGQNHVVNLWTGMNEDARQRATLILVGAETFPGALQTLLNQIALLGNPDDIIYAGFTYRPTEWLSASDLYLSGSEFEGMPLGPIEAAGSGLDLLVSDIVGHSMLPDFVGKFSLDRITDGSAQMNALILRSELNPLERKGAGWLRGREFREKFGVATMAMAYEALYRSRGKVELQNK